MNRERRKFSSIRDCPGCTVELAVAVSIAVAVPAEVAAVVIVAPPALPKLLGAPRFPQLPQFHRLLLSVTSKAAGSDVAPRLAPAHLFPGCRLCLLIFVMTSPPTCNHPRSPTRPPPHTHLHPRPHPHPPTPLPTNLSGRNNPGGAGRLRCRRGAVQRRLGRAAAV